MSRYKYPRTPHLPWSPGYSSDDLHTRCLSEFENEEVVVTEKMDGENTSLYCDGMHARSLDSRHHPSRNWVKSLHGKIAHQIPKRWRICGENLYARHSIGYDQLSSFFLVFSIWNPDNQCLSWDETIAMAKDLGLHTVKELYRGKFSEARIRSIPVNTETSEGYVLRLASSFAYENFKGSIAKWVRNNHVQSDEHWMHKAIVANSLKS